MCERGFILVGWHLPPSSIPYSKASAARQSCSSRRVVPADSADVFVKLEYFSPTGSYKDRMALAMIEGAEKRGTLKPGMRVIEYTGGSTGSSLAMVCAIKGYAFAPLSSDAFAREKLETMRAFGADLELVPSDGGMVTPALFDRFRARIAILKDEPGTFYTDQFNNQDALDGYGQIGVELLEQLGTIDAFCGAVGTGGMLVGVSRALKAGGSRARIVALEPAGSPALTQGRGGAHRVEGTATGRVPPHLTSERLRRSASHRRGRGARHGSASGARGRRFRGHVVGPECPGGAADCRGARPRPPRRDRRR